MLVVKLLHVCSVGACMEVEPLKDWKLGLLINIPKFPLDAKGNLLTQLGLLMHKQDFLRVPMWPFIDEVLIMTPPKQMQLGVNFMNPKPVQVSRYMACIVISGDNKVASNMVWEAFKHSKAMFRQC